MLAADADLRSGRVGSASLLGHLDQFGHAFLVERLERVRRKDASWTIGPMNLPGIVAGEAERHLGKVVGAKAEELRMLGDLEAACRAARGNSIIVPIR